MKKPIQEQKSLKKYVEILEHFNTKIEDLSDYPEFTNPDSTGVQIHFPGEIERYGPDPRFIYVVNAILRFFLNSNEDTSLANMEKYYKEMPISKDVKDEFCEMRYRINSFLDAGSGVEIRFKESHEVGFIGYCDPRKGGKSRRELLNLFRFGYYEHMNDKNKPQQLASIRKMPDAYAVIEQISFIKILRELIQYFSRIKTINGKAISELKDII